MGQQFTCPKGMGDGRIFYAGGQSGGKAEGLGGKEKSTLLNIKRVRKLKY